MLERKQSLVSTRAPPCMYDVLWQKIDLPHFRIFSFLFENREGEELMAEKKKIRKLNDEKVAWCGTKCNECGCPIALAFHLLPTFLLTYLSSSAAGGRYDASFFLMLGCVHTNEGAALRAVVCYRRSSFIRFASFLLRQYDDNVPEWRPLPLKRSGPYRVLVNE